MATKRFTKSAIDWAKLAERVPENQKVSYIALKQKSDNYLRRVYANPEAPPKIDFASYKSKVPIAGLVDNFQKQYEALKIPFPTENITPQIDEQEKTATKAAEDFIAESNKRIVEHQARIAKWDNVLPYEEMTWEDYCEQFPNEAMDPVEKPTLWPHDDQNQPWYYQKGGPGYVEGGQQHH